MYYMESYKQNDIYMAVLMVKFGLLDKSKRPRTAIFVLCKGIHKMVDEMNMKLNKTLSILNYSLLNVVRILILTISKFCQHPPHLEVLKYMSECIISRRGSNGSGGGGEGVFTTEYITFNQNWTVPNHKGNISVRIFGGGGGSNGYMYFGGGSGWMNNGEFNNLTPGTSVKITIGGSISSNTYASGGSSSFGNYLSANGGSGGWNWGGGIGGSGGAGSNRRSGGTGFQFGGGGGAPGGRGGIWGGGGGGYGDYSMTGSFDGGSGGQYGGGGGGGSNSSNGGNGGDGGEYGGGGGGGHIRGWQSAEVNPQLHGGGRGGRGGTYGGNGGNGGTSELSARYAQNGYDGTNTIGDNSIPNEFRGSGIKGIVTVPYLSNLYMCGGGGGGGYGGNGGNGGSETAGGGGGYGSNGGNGGGSYSGGGGGGYGGDGGTYGGGGGGYGKISIGGNGPGGGGGGYYCPGGGINNTHGGGGYGIVGNDGNLVSSFASGGDSSHASESGICIIQYYKV